jgi:hypothetical protein
VVLRGISPAFARLSPCCGQVVHAILTLTPLYKPCRSTVFSCDLHALTTPPTFVLSQDQTLHLRARSLRTRSLGTLSGCHVRTADRPGHSRWSREGPAQAPSRPAHARLHLATYSHVKALHGEEGTAIAAATPHNRSLGLAAKLLPENSAPPFADSAPTTNRPPGSGSPGAPYNLNGRGHRVKVFFAAKTPPPRHT